MAELVTVLGTQDLENLVEIVLVDQHNHRALEKARKKKGKG